VHEVVSLRTSNAYFTLSVLQSLPLLHIINNYPLCDIHPFLAMGLVLNFGSATLHVRETLGGTSACGMPGSAVDIIVTILIS
jgi:hypothetical protein